MLATLTRWVVPHRGNGYHPHALRHRSLHLASLVMVLLKAAVVGALLVAVPTPASFSSLTATRVLALTNAARQKAGLSALRSDPRLNRAAEAKVQDMLRRQYFDHTAPDGTTSWYWFTLEGYRYDTAGENLATGFDSSEELIAAWLDSPAHAANILGDTYTDTGIAIVTGKLLGESTTLAVQLFGSTQGEEEPAPTPAAPVIGSTDSSASASASTPSAAPPTPTVLEPTVPVAVASAPAVAVTVPWSKVSAVASLTSQPPPPIPGGLRFAAAALPGIFVAILTTVLVLLATMLLVHARQRHLPVVVHALAVVGIGFLLLQVKLHLLEGAFGAHAVLLR